MKNCFLVVVGCIFTASSSLAAEWEFGNRSVSVAIATTDKTTLDTFDGTKFILEGEYTFKYIAGEPAENRSCCAQPSSVEHFVGNFDVHLDWDVDKSDLEYATLGFTPWATTWERERDSSRKLQTTRELLQWAAIRTGHDDPIGIESYTEIAVARGGRVWGYKRSEQSPVTVWLGVQASMGWAWADSNDPAYGKVSNPFAGLHWDVAVEHERLGKLYFDFRTSNGFSFSSPGRGHPTARSARFRFGYAKELARCLSLDFFVEKRSFNVTDAVLPQIYNKSGRVAVDFSCRFGPV